MKNNHNFYKITQVAFTISNVRTYFDYYNTQAIDSSPRDVANFSIADVAVALIDS